MLFERGRWHYAIVPSFRPESSHFEQSRQVNRMADFMSSELAYMRLEYGAAVCSGLAAQFL